MTEETHQIIKDDGACLPPDWKKLKKSETKDISEIKERIQDILEEPENEV